MKCNMSIIHFIALFTLLSSCGATVTVHVDPTTVLSLNGHQDFDPKQFLSGHLGFGSSNPNITLLVDNKVHVGRSFLATAVMSACTENTTNPGYVNETSLIDVCKRRNMSLDGMPSSFVDMVVSGKTAPYYLQSQGAGALSKTYPLMFPSQMLQDSQTQARDNLGFLPKDHDAAAQYWSVFLKHCMNPYNERFLCEVWQMLASSVYSEPVR